MTTEPPSHAEKQLNKFIKRRMKTPTKSNKIVLNKENTLKPLRGNIIIQESEGSPAPHTCPPRQEAPGS